MTAPILVTGATGNVGREVVRGLAARGCLVRTAVLDAAGTSRLPNNGAETVAFDFTRPATFAAAFDGIQKMFLVRPPAIANIRRDMAPAIRAAGEAGVEHIVFLSLLGVENRRIVPHYRIERAIEAARIPATFLRASFFMQNLNTTHRDEIASRGQIAVPAGTSRTSFIDVRDIAAVAVLALTEDGHVGRSYELTGCEALDYYQVAELFTQVLGRRIVYTNPATLTFLVDAVRLGVPLPFAMVMTFLYMSTRGGIAVRTTRDVQRLLGRPPVTLRQYIEDYRPSWEPVSAFQNTD